MADAVAEFAAELAQADAGGGEISHAAAFGVACGYDDVQVLRFQLGQHLRQDGFVVLQIGVHNGDEGCGGGHHSFDAR